MRLASATLGAETERRPSTRSPTRESGSPHFPSMPASPSVTSWSPCPRYANSMALSAARRRDARIAGTPEPAIRDVLPRSPEYGEHRTPSPNDVGRSRRQRTERHHRTLSTRRCRGLLDHDLRPRTVSIRRRDDRCGAACRRLLRCGRSFRHVRDLRYTVESVATDEFRSGKRGMRRGFRLGRSSYHHGHRSHWPRDVLSAEDECDEELAVIADHFASLGPISAIKGAECPRPVRAGTYALRTGGGGAASTTR